MDGIRSLLFAAFVQGAARAPKLDLKTMSAAPASEFIPPPSSK